MPKLVGNGLEICNRWYKRFQVLGPISNLTDRLSTLALSIR
ncbi:hypothetical protein MtrunA17_Chr5g0400651 [Medicago truncatula]|uniref:Uncharacterized protein n=1 Tax=Medicago truncatula TaxID=3880 RepID=A0A396HMS7_MEDTR|nr:hypothetical protein MtrunA17_Chr5g0400651 [Medicago truncatula]